MFTFLLKMMFYNILEPRVAILIKVKNNKEKAQPMLRYLRGSWTFIGGLCIF